MDSTKKVLTSLNKLGSEKYGTVLFVGGPGVGKHELGKAVLEKDTKYSINVRTVTCLPLPVHSEEMTSSRPRIDLVVFVVSLTNRHSILIVEKSLDYLDTAFFVGKVCFIASHVGNHAQTTVNVEKITNLADHYDSPLLTFNIEDEDSKAQVGARIVNLLEISAGFRRNISPLLIETTRLPYKPEKL